MAPSKSTADFQKACIDRIRAFQRSDPKNKKCADCVEVGPTYICLNFQTFICQTCSGVHREFGHRIKSISLSEWTADDVASIEKGGNSVASQQFLASWSESECPLPAPPPANPQQVRDFIKAKYVEKKWVQVPEPAPVEAAAVEAPLAAAPASPTATDVPDVAAAPQAVPASALAAPAAAAPASAVAAAPTPAAPAPAAPLLDLLSDGCATDVQVVNEAAFPAMPSSPSSITPVADDQGNSEWTADFGIGSPEKLKEPAEFGISTPPKQTEPADLLSGSPTRPATTGNGVQSKDGLLDLDLCFGSAPEAAVESLAPPALPSITSAPAASGISESTLPAVELETEDNDVPQGNVGDRLREAVLRGSNNDIMKMFEHCQRPAKKAPQDDRFAALRGDDFFSDLGAAEASPCLVLPVQHPEVSSSSQPMRPVQLPEVSPRSSPMLPVQPSEAPDTAPKQEAAGNVGDRLREAVLSGQNDKVMQLFEETAPPKVSPTEVMQMFGTGSQTEVHKPPFESFMEMPPAEQPHASACGKGMSAQQLMQLDPQALVHMQAMIQQALHVQAQTRAVWEAPAAKGPEISDNALDISETQPKQFDDLITAFGNSRFGIKV